jgi:hypothetical protein
MLKKCMSRQIIPSPVPSPRYVGPEEENLHKTLKYNDIAATLYGISSVVVPIHAALFLKIGFDAKEMLKDLEACGAVQQTQASEALTTAIPKGCGQDFLEASIRAKYDRNLYIGVGTLLLLSSMALIYLTLKADNKAREFRRKIRDLAVKPEEEEPSLKV